MLRLDVISGMKEGKVWGTTQALFCHNNVECHLIHFAKGGYCSTHKHKNKYNRFIVIRGRLKISVTKYNVPHSAVLDETILEVGQITDVAPDVEHKFEALEDGSAIEIYWVDLDPNDIERNGSQGGILGTGRE